MADFTIWVEQNKALWSRVYDEVIQPSLEKEWNKREERHQNQLKEKEKSHEALLEHLNNEISKSARLSSENAQLRDQAQTKSTIQGEKGAISQSISVEEHRRLVEENEQLKQQLARRNAEAAPSFSQLSKKYSDATQQVKYLQRKNATVMQKNKDMKESVRAWQEYADRQSGKRKHKFQSRVEPARLQSPASRVSPGDEPNIPSSPRSTATPRLSPTLTDLGRSSPALMVPHAPEGTAHQSTTTLDSVLGEHDPSENADITPKPRPRINGSKLSKLQRITSDHDSRQQTHPSSSQTTVDERDESMTRHEQIVGVEDEDDDMPEFVSERSLKRKRGEPTTSRFEIYADRLSDGTPVRPYRVKEEQCSSPPVSAYKLLHYEATMDLDDPASNLLQTPRHNRRRLSIPATSAETPRRRRCNSAPSTQEIKSENEIDQVLMPNNPVRLTTESLMLPEVASTETRAFSEPMEPTQIETNVLKSIDPNIVNTVSEEPPNKRSRNTGSRYQQKHESLSESNETLPFLDSELRLPPTSARARMNQRFRDLKDLQSPSKAQSKTLQTGPTKVKIGQFSTPSSSSHTTYTPGLEKKSAQSVSKRRSDSREDPTPDRPIWTMKPPETRSSARKKRDSSSKEQVPLREKPVTELGIQDFKPNPAYNQGYSYAFSETVRKRGDRMCLPGCTNPQCCGSTFRTFAAAQAPLSASQEEALLEDYLGEAYSKLQLTQMSSEERQELVLQARTRKMAKESGKHREAYQRRRTPPGFWRVDFPTTQEREEDRARAKEQERLETHERWIEANRRGGKWIFRDE
ncbi:hypothetical protein COCC4DRAFT_192924 [Bipolaris maydis ATCC 48331]|uniref:DNA endonuclease activator Ctp1 C-terminal domain-containing protein n=2 Tax=Cochliobolus heterostrophus TaxID=5016 RepID=M2TM40_COCH5|nr:uncharacterized protein COCC4DRAFT_192924 [Bipolaris maydis ATCC 48331]EMD87599.1 hypothetical protein COCHEDRAFT_1184794 [Bipolaris maydis C5]KAJ5023135.1 DNA repair protein endonuclease SAE2/CtIP C-terminus-domain-containing protein [Bipolaris maydis]ENI06798.1 hypothetical protein COCC4DRAFT_192924 [Bipolaris maydis ATCC 48331]KAJ5056115.1 DNA repair protein endonuclease SAE2/CtIP C-terminus-domain-containing protein [Bipolaris maydis]KAJ6212007.1 DNA repair protein endonuclease SAE2/CtI